MTFVADGRIRRPDAFSGLVIPPIVLANRYYRCRRCQTLLVQKINARTGRVVAERLLIFGDAFSPNA